MIYDFYCKNCGKRRQVEIKLADYDTEKDRQKCPKCGEKIERVIEWQGYASGSGDGRNKKKNITNTKRWKQNIF